MKSLLILNKKQFGYHTDSYEIAKHLKKTFSITFLCFDSGLPPFIENDITVIYISSKGKYFQKGIRFLKACLLEVKKEYDYYFLDYFPSCSVVRLVTKKNIILDFRTGSVATCRWKRKINNSFRTTETKFFDQVTLISEGLRQLLKIPSHKSFILPLGANIISHRNKIFDSPRLFYIGTLHNRNILQTLEGLVLFLKEHPQYRDQLSYDIVGAGYANEESKLKAYIQKKQLQKSVIIHGQKRHHAIKYLFEKSNIGVSYVPITDYFNHQPPTNTFEYIMSGMLCIATSTNENRKYINTKNGILCHDNPRSFSNAIRDCIANFPNAKSSEIRETLRGNSWDIVAEQFGNILLNGK